MKKLKLDVEALQVESFEAETRRVKAGTVRAMSETMYDEETCASTCGSEAGCNGDEDPWATWGCERR